MIEEKFSHAFAQLGLSVHDISVSALAAAVIVLGVVLLMELRSVLRMRQVVDNQLGRVFEQLDLLRFETQQLLEGQQGMQSATADSAALTRSSPPGVVPPLVAASPTLTLSAAAGVPTVAPAAIQLPTSPTASAPATMAPGPVYQNAAALAASGMSSREIAERLGLAAGEARLLSSLAQARARRAEPAGA